ncbi:MAG: hypothetical protein NTY44_08245 [Deltaproteobacteria bacterium]|nr:hypothetical protein [Deltaproteobacteria bacterium]
MKEKEPLSALEFHPLNQSPFTWTGLASAFKKAGLVEVTRRSEMRPMMGFCISAP